MGKDREEGMKAPPNCNNWLTNFSPQNTTYSEMAVTEEKMPLPTN